MLPAVVENNNQVHYCTYATVSNIENLYDDLDYDISINAREL